MPRVLLVGRGAPEHGGISVFLDQMMTGPIGERMDCRFLNLARSEGTDRGGAVSISNISRTLSDAFLVFRAASDVDVVHLHSSLAPTPTLVRAGFLTWAARARGRPVVIHAHGGRFISWSQHRFAKLIARLVLAPAAAVLVVSSRLADAVMTVTNPDKVFVVTNGIELEMFPSPHEPVVNGRVLYIGHLSRRKGLVDLRDAGRLLVERGVQFEIVIVGGEPPEGASEADLVLGELDGGELDGSIGVVGPIDHADIPEHLAGAQVFCLPSWWEATPLSVLEAMAAGLPVVATDVGDVARLVVDGETGLLVHPKRPEELANALGVLLTDPDRCRAMGTAGRQRVEEQFDLVETHARIADHLEAAISGKDPD